MQWFEFQDNKHLVRLYEIKTEIALPPIYKAFLENHKLGDGNLDAGNFIHPKLKIAVPSGSWIFKYDSIELSFTGFYNVEELLKDYESYLHGGDEWIKYGLIRIGDTGKGGGLFIGSRPENLDKIIDVIWDENRKTEIAGNVFEFLRDLNFIEDRSNMDDNIEYNQFLRHWGDAAWRIN